MRDAQVSSINDRLTSVGFSLLIVLAFYANSLQASECIYKGGEYPCPEDCIEDGGRSLCSEPIVVRSNPDFPADESEWQYRNCIEEGDNNCPAIATWCCVAGGVWGGGPGCTGPCDELPDEIWGSGRSYADDESSIVVGDMRILGGSCGVQKACSSQVLDSGWGVESESYNCWSGETQYINGIPVLEFRHRQYEYIRGQQCDVSISKNLYTRRDRDVMCPAGYSTEFVSNSELHCYRELPVDCPAVGNPVLPSSGVKYHLESLSDFPSEFGGFHLRYNSAGLSRLGEDSESSASERNSAFWFLSFSRRLESLSPSPVALARIREDDGTYTYYRNDGSEWGAVARSGSQVVRLTENGDLVGWLRKDLLGGLEWFDAEGRLVKAANGAGNTLELEYRESGELESIRDERGRSIDFDKPSSEGQRIVLAGGVELAMSNDEEGRLSSLEFDGEPVREFIYKSMSSSQKYRYLLTEIRSDGEHVSSYEYDGQGRVVESYKLLSNGETVERYQYQYERQGDSVYTTVTQPSGSASTLEFAPINGPQRLVSNTSPCTECGGVSDQSRLYTDQGLLEEAVDFNGVRTEYSYNEDGLEVERREGIASGASSPIRTVLTDWHTELRLPVLELHYEGEVGGLPERLMKWKYNDGGQVTARCEVDPLVSGSDSYNCGSSDTAPSGVRQFLKRYCRESDEDFGTAACPTEGYLRWEELHSRAGGLRTYSYYISDSGDGSYRAGDLWEVVNSLGQVTEVLEYDPAGRPIRIRGPNGVDSVMTYGKRGRLLTMGINGETTSYDYLANGLIERVTQPDGSYLDFEYDGAQRLKAIENTFGERVEYELDAAGNRVAEYIQDETGTLSFELQQLFDQLGRLESTINGSGYQTDYEYDAAGNLTQVVDALENATIHEYDSLNRLSYCQVWCMTTG